MLVFEALWSLITGDVLDGYIGMALVGGAAAVGTLLIASLVRRGKK